MRTAKLELTTGGPDNPHHVAFSNNSKKIFNFNYLIRKCTNWNRKLKFVNFPSGVINVEICSSGDILLVTPTWGCSQPKNYNKGIMHVGLTHLICNNGCSKTNPSQPGMKFWVSIFWNWILTSARHHRA